MTKENLKRLVDRLDKELKETPITDEATRKKLSKLKTDIAKKLGTPKKAKPDGLIDQLKDQALKLETRYPALTQLLNQISDSLSKMGI